MSGSDLIFILNEFQDVYTWYQVPWLLVRHSYTLWFPSPAKSPHRFLLAAEFNDFVVVSP